MLDGCTVYGRVTSHFCAAIGWLSESESHHHDYLMSTA